MQNYHDNFKMFPWGRSKGAIDSPVGAVVILPCIEQGKLWDRLTNPSINGTSLPDIVRGDNPQVTTHNLIRQQFRDSGTMKIPVPVYSCPSRFGRPTISETFTSGTSSTEGLCGDYGVCYGSGTSAPDLENGVFQWSISTAAIGRKIASITDGTSNTLLIGEKHVTPAELGKWPGDFCIYNAGSGAGWQASGRMAGAAFPLALNPNEPLNGQFGRPTRSWCSSCCGRPRGADCSSPPGTTPRPGRSQRRHRSEFARLKRRGSVMERIMPISPAGRACWPSWLPAAAVYLVTGTVTPRTAHRSPGSSSSRARTPIDGTRAIQRRRFKLSSSQPGDGVKPGKYAP